MDQNKDKAENLIEEVGKATRKGWCQAKYLLETAECGEMYWGADDWDYDGCMETALLNRTRCEQGLPPVPYRPSNPPPRLPYGQ